MDVDIFSSPVKVEDVDDLKKRLMCNPTIAKKCIILKLERHSAFFGQEPNRVRDIISVFGKENIEDVEVVSEKLLLVTLCSEMSYIADSVRSFRCGFSSLNYYVHCMHSIAAYVEAKLSGIPRFVVSVNIHLLVLQIRKMLPFLIDISVEYISFCSNTNSSGYFLVKAKTEDVAASKSQLDKWVSVPFMGFDGILELKITGPVKGRPAPKLPAEPRSDLIVDTYW